ncbi:MAG: glycosyltransferase family 2 protein [Bacteroidales bacterium]|jgi:dolichol-phosphate mannosyltransferase|nr:glycosyltransferase family 2 protein [Bacteroidales bacterium]
MLSLVIPVFNEEKLIDELISRTVRAVGSFTPDYELIFVDDGSTDQSLTKLLQHRTNNSRIKVLALSKNFGHQAAYTAGLEHAKGDILAMMDGDLQDPPELLAEMYGKISGEDYDIVSAKRTGRKSKPARKFYTKLFHFIFRNIAELKNTADYGNYSMMKRIAADAILSMKEKIRYLPGLRSYVGFSHCEVKYIRDDRYNGKSKMSLRKLLALAGDAIFSFSRFPIRLCLVLGIIGTVVFLGAGVYVIIAKATGIAVPGWSSTLLSLYFLGSIQLVFLGIIGEYIYRNYKESQNRPLYFVRKFYDGNTGE